MNNEVWDYLYGYFIALEESYSKISILAANAQPTSTNEIMGSDVGAAEPIDCLPIYQEIAKSLEECQKQLTPLLTKMELKYLLCALIFHCDETVLTKKLPTNRLIPTLCEWPGLQKKMLHCRDGGERFFNHLDKLLQHSRDYKMAIEVYYFCLKQGFVGCYFNDPKKIQYYLTRCAEVITKNVRLRAHVVRGAGSEYKNLRDEPSNESQSGVVHGAFA